jgi:hypothetical protein
MSKIHYFVTNFVEECMSNNKFHTGCKIEGSTHEEHLKMNAHWKLLLISGWVIRKEEMNIVDILKTKKYNIPRLFFQYTRKYKK